jgi:hypothetical protein
MPSLLTIAFAAVASAAVQVDIAPGTPCVGPDTLAGRLTKLGVPLARPGDLEVTVVRRGEEVFISGYHAATSATFERAVPATAEDCDAVERVVAALVRSWSDATPLSAPRPPPPTAPAPAPVPRPKPAPAPPPPPPEPAVRLLPYVPQINLPHGGAPARERPFTGGSGPTDLPAELERKVAQTRPSTPGPASTASLVARLALRAGVAGGPTPSAAPLGSASFHVGNEWFGAELEGGFAGAVREPFEGGSVWASMQWLTLSARVDLPVYQRLRFEGLLGLRGTRIAVGSDGFAVNQQRELYALGLYAAAGLDIRLIGPLSLVFRGVFTLRFPEDRLVIEGVGEALTLRVWQVGAEGGLAVWFP